MEGGFDYDTAFTRNIGWLTVAEQARLRASRIAIAGMGGVGGVHLLTLARFGVGAFTIADYDRFDLANLNRQAGALMSTLGQPKAEVLARMVRDINPEVDLRCFDDGVDPARADVFLEGVDLYVDALDFFAFDARRAVFAACRRRGIPAITAAPLGMGAAVMVFTADSMSFEDYFGFEGCDDDERAVRFLLGLSPGMLQRAYLVDPTRVNLSRREGPSTIAACQICAGVTATETIKLLLGRGKVLSAPWAYQFDAYRNRLKRTWRPGGWRNPLQRIGLWLGRRQLERMKALEAAHD
ncbi:ThiF family adenylyltransferase [Thauera aminoaromatica]|jgi:molybdopterin/thiamine biosynthesis adenylyltransferase|uniref:ThiF family adenylyltransferase n=1 Tax=Thauera aminoaromatica TaxID=164330 RepID=C4ZJJ6_THASP|nr:ThiF family adenylyltransferase [Thauera aminoaromatica]ACK54378.1 UBA/THIF-type NAD/FAD binding protein [Thauera aminoaromatica]TXH78229.1 MAG: ThiF family adenylyltransferase [Thauera aminoaromatica]